VAIDRTGLDALHKALLEHRAYAGQPAVAGGLRRGKIRMRLRNALREELLSESLKERGLTAELERAVDRVVRGEISPHRAARELMERMIPHGRR
jgi:putative protein kinase ArgK-like GTPase of G3E family